MRYAVGVVEVCYCMARRRWMIRAPGFVDFWCLLQAGKRDLSPPRDSNGRELDVAARTWVERARLDPSASERIQLRPAREFRVVRYSPRARVECFTEEER